MKRNKTFIKSVLRSDDVYIQFTEEELKEFGWEKGQKFTFKTHDDGSVELIPYKKIEIELDDFPVEVLKMLIKESCDKDISVNDIITDLLKKYIEEEDKNV